MANNSFVAKRIEAAGPFLRDIIFGVHDALLTNIGIITGFVTAFQNNRLILIAALIDVVISAFAMGFGTYLSRTSETDYLKDKLEEKTHADVQDVMANPIAASVVMWFSYVISGSIPLIPFMLTNNVGLSVRIALTLTFLIFFIVGMLKGLVTKTNPWTSGLTFLVFGSVAATVGYAIGSYGQQFIR